MSIEVQDLLTRKARRFGASEQSDDFQEILIAAVNDALNDIDSRLGLSTAAVTATGNSVDLDEETYLSVLSAGIDFYVASQGEWTNADPAKLEIRFERILRETHMHYLQDQTLSVRFGDLDA